MNHIVESADSLKIERETVSVNIIYLRRDMIRVRLNAAAAVQIGLVLALLPLPS